VISKDPTYPVWRAGANSATAITTDGNLDINGLKVPAGSYTLFVALRAIVIGPDRQQETGEWGSPTTRARSGRVKMTVTKPPAPIETFQISLEATAETKGSSHSLDNDVATVPFTVHKCSGERFLNRLQFRAPGRKLRREAGRIGVPQSIHGPPASNAGVPIGGVGAGSISSADAPTARLEIFNRPEKGKSPAYAFPPSGFATAASPLSAFSKRAFNLPMKDPALGSNNVPACLD